MNHICFGRQRTLIVSSVIRLLAVALLAASTLLTPFVASEAMASSYGYTWRIEFDFDSDLNGRLTVEAGPGVVGALDKVYVSEEFVVACTRDGVVTQSGSSATFAGGHLVCKLDLGTAINRVFVRCSQIDEACRYKVAPTESYENLHMAARIFSPQPGPAPLLHMPDVFFGPNTTAADVTLYNRLTPAGGMTSLFVTSPLGTWMNYGALYSCQFGPPCASEFSVNGVMQPGGPGPFVDPAQIRMEAVELIIGHDPLSGYTVPNGTQIDYLMIDPPNMGNG